MSKQQNTPMTFCPFNGGRYASPGHLAEDVRREYPNVKWTNNPWTGGARDPRDVQSDPTGILIIPPGEPVYADTSHAADSIDAFRWFRDTMRVKASGQRPGRVAFASDSIAKSALQRQEGGSHYKDMVIQPIEYIHKNGIPFAEGSVIKYVSRWRAKNGIADLKKARHVLDLLIELEEEAARG